MNAMTPVCGTDTAFPAATHRRVRKFDISDLFQDEGSLNYDISARRAAYVAEVLGGEPPARLVDEDDCPAPEVMDFVRRTGASLDFIFMGDLRSMVMADCARRQEWFAGEGDEA
ncbi:hypothetical protein [Paracoccus sp. IB05]|uniref:hypothetical protein n=1 Tax=Paracoccus sp. IB05 TaxID=2779367 RepID=UPI0018E8C10C|nr:hypothetical protein [Paracoccus sp. IB05]MBJ2151359.1 hypothetical protein [Paracoccus sp. IB05]